MPDPISTLAGDPDDILRSLRRYVALLLNSPPWTVRLQRVAVSDDERPVAILEPGPLTTPFARVGTVTQGDVQKQQTFSIACYPVVMQTAPASAEVARQLVTLLDAGFSRGLASDDDPPVLIGAPWRVPVYAFSGVPVEGPSRQGPTVAYMHANVDQFTARPLQDAMDELRYTVMVTLRVSWWQGGRVPPAAPIAVAVPGAGSFR